jgi:hypothetical protein
MRKKINAYRILMGKLGEKRLREVLDVDGRMILNWMLEKYDYVVRIQLLWLRVVTRERLL